MKKYIPIILGIIMMACSGGGIAYSYYNEFINGFEYEFQTRSGRECVAYASSLTGAGGLSCNWNDPILHPLQNN